MSDGENNHDNNETTPRWLCLMFDPSIPISIRERIFAEAQFLPITEDIDIYLRKNLKNGIDEFGKYQYCMLLVSRGNLCGVDLFVDYLENDFNNSLLEMDEVTGERYKLMIRENIYMLTGLGIAVADFPAWWDNNKEKYQSISVLPHRDIGRLVPRLYRNGATERPLQK